MLLVKQLVKCKDGIYLEDRMHIVRLDWLFNFWRIIENVDIFNKRI